MKIIITFQIKYKQDQKQLLKILKHHGFNKIHETLYINNIQKQETEQIKQEIQKITKPQDNIIIIPICTTCNNKITQYGRKIYLETPPYKIIS